MNTFLFIFFLVFKLLIICFFNHTAKIHKLFKHSNFLIKKITQKIKYIHIYIKYIHIIVQIIIIYYIWMNYRGGYSLRVAVLSAWGIGAKSAGCPGRCMGSTPSLSLHKYFLLSLPLYECISPLTCCINTFKIKSSSLYINIFYSLPLHKYPTII